MNIPLNQKVERIICPFDFTATGTAGLDYAGRLAAALNATLTIFYVQPSIWPEMLQLYDDHVRCADSRLTGFQWPEGDARDVLLRDCRADLASFRFATLQRTTLAGCVLRDADFQGARLESVCFLDCDLSGASFAGARFERSELRGCRLDGLRGVEGLAGAALEWPAIVELAGTFAAALGVRVIDDAEAPTGAP